jgi:hypothetical protein
VLASFRDGTGRVCKIERLFDRQVQEDAERLVTILLNYLGISTRACGDLEGASSYYYCAICTRVRIVPRSILLWQIDLLRSGILSVICSKSSILQSIQSPKRTGRLASGESQLHGDSQQEREGFTCNNARSSAGGENRKKRRQTFWLRSSKDGMVITPNLSPCFGHATRIRTRNSTFTSSLLLAPLGHFVVHHDARHCF